MKKKLKEKDIESIFEENKKLKEETKVMQAMALQEN